MSDADEMFSTATGLDVVKQDAFHRLTTDNVVGEGGDGWGFDVRKLLGAPVSMLVATQPVLVEVLTRDERILSAEVTLTGTTTRGLADVRLEVNCTTAQGPFRFVKSVLDLTVSDLEGQ
jgi:hypothetical protein